MWKERNVQQRDSQAGRSGMWKERNVFNRTSKIGAVEGVRRKILLRP
jgi:hypothetical protein